MATITITTTTQQDARIAEAIGHILGLDRNATAGEVKTWLVEHLRSAVHRYEVNAAVATATAGISPIDPT